MSVQLADAHQELRRQVTELRDGLGHRRPGDGVLLTRCLAFCAALTVHHQGEDDGMFAELLRERPDLAGTIGKLVEDHAMITAILTRVRELADRAGDGGADLAAVGAELDGLAAIMESHFTYEERTISRALDDGAPDTGWHAKVFGLRTN
ncbi:MAG TPA: hemerythrin domain-containing protein [Streptosporangiaceae bacterium]